MNILYVVMPAYNEEANIQQTIKDWYPVVESHNEEGKSRLCIFNDGSKDKTSDVAKQLCKDYPLLEVIDKPNGGHGQTVIHAYNYAINNGADYIFQTDSDGQTNPNEFEQFWNDREKYDGQFGNRTVRGDGNDRAFVEHVVCFLLKMYFGVSVPDANAPYRLLNANVLKKHLVKLPSDYNLPNIMITTYFTFYKERVCFKEISFKPRSAGVNSVNFKRIFKIGCKSLVDFHNLKKGMK